MSVERWKRVNELFQQALDLDPEARRAFVSKECGGDLEMQAEVDSLLAAYDQSPGFLTQDTLAQLDEPPEAPALAPGSRLGPYQVLGLLASG